MRCNSIAFGRKEYELFILLISVSGIGPKVGLGILSGITTGGFQISCYQWPGTAINKVTWYWEEICRATCS